MAVQLQFKRGSSAPSAGSFAVGEPAWDSTNSKFYIKNNLVIEHPSEIDKKKELNQFAID